jgi:hypothetical protein
MDNERRTTNKTDAIERPRSGIEINEKKTAQCQVNLTLFALKDHGFSSFIDATSSGNREDESRLDVYLDLDTPTSARGRR